mgnify:CR=1 FL=1
MLMLRRLLSNVAKPARTAGTAPSSTRLNVGCGRQIRAGWVNLDSQALSGVDVVADLDACRRQPLPFADDSFEELYASHVLEHLNDPLACMQELHRVARHGARLEVRVPHGASDEADIDPTHVRRYFPRSFQYFSQARYRNFDYGYRGDWDTETIQLVVPDPRYAGLSDQEIWALTATQRNVATEMRVLLRAIKPARAWQAAAAGAPKVTFLRGALPGDDPGTS